MALQLYRVFKCEVLTLKAIENLCYAMLASATTTTKMFLRIPNPPAQRHSQLHRMNRILQNIYFSLYIYLQNPHHRQYKSLHLHISAESHTE